jgi:hypothetical protein
VEVHQRPQPESARAFSLLCTVGFSEVRLFVLKAAHAILFGAANRKFGGRVRVPCIHQK